MYLIHEQINMLLLKTQMKFVRLKVFTLSGSYRKGESAREMLNDKQHIAEQKARYQAYETVVDEVVIEPGTAGACLDDYDDEYDDTYDMNQVGANDLDGDSLLNRR